MKTIRTPFRILTTSAAALLAFAPASLHAEAKTIAPSGTPRVWGTAGNWTPAGVPTAADSVTAAYGGTTAIPYVDVRASGLAAVDPVTGFRYAFATDLAITNVNAGVNIILRNDGTGADIAALNLNGSRGSAIPIISFSGLGTAEIARTGLNSMLLNVVLSGTPGDRIISVGGVAGTQILTISSYISELDGAKTVVKAGTGSLILSGINTYSGGTRVTAGVLQANTLTTLGTGALVIDGGTFDSNVAGSYGVSSITVNPGGTFAVHGNTNNNNITLAGGSLASRTNDGGTYAGDVNVTATSILAPISYSTPANAQDVTISGILSSTGAQTLNITGIAAGSAKAAILTNTGNTFTGQINVNANQRLRSAAAGGVGSTLNGVAVNLGNNAALQIRDNGLGSDSTLTYTNALTFTGAAATVDVDRKDGANTGNTVNFGPISIGATTLNALSANGYKLQFGATTLTGNATFSPTTAASSLVLGPVGGGAFNLTKTGLGSLTLTGSNTYTGLTDIDGGTVVLTGTLASSEVTVKSGAIYDVTGVAGTYTLGANQLLAGAGTVLGAVVAGPNSTIIGGANGTGTLSIASLSLAANSGITSVRSGATGTSTAVTNLDGLSASGPVRLNVTGNVVAGYSEILTYSGNIGGAGLGAFVLGTYPQRAVNPVVTATATAIGITFDGIDFPIWKGAGGSEWSNAVLPTKNWVLSSNNATGTDFFVEDKVLFSDLPTSATPVVDVSVTDVVVADVRFETTKAYTLSGSKAITGASAFLKTGTGSVNITSTANTFSGDVTISGGSVSAAKLAPAGAPSSLGAGTVINVGNGATLNYSGAAMAVADPAIRQIAIDAGGAILGTSNALNLGLLSGTGALTFSGTGAGSVYRLQAAVANTLSGPVTISGATVVAPVLAGGVNPGSLGTGPSITLGGGGTLKYTGGDMTNDVAGALRPVIVTTGGGKLESATSLVLGPLTLDADLTINGVGAAAGTTTTRFQGNTDNTGTGKITLTGQGTVISQKTGNAIAIPGDFEIGSGITFRFSSFNPLEQISDNSTVTVNGNFNPRNDATTPAAGYVTETVKNVVVNSGGMMNTGRNTVGTVKTPFVVTNLATVNAGGEIISTRGGGFSATELLLNGGTALLDGTTGTAGQESYIQVGVGGLHLASGTISFNAGTSQAAVAGSLGSIVSLSGNVTSTGASTLLRADNAVANYTTAVAQLDLNGATRTFDVTDTLTVGTTARTVNIVDNLGALAGLTKTGSGTLVLGGINTFGGATEIAAGAVDLRGSITASMSTHVGANGTLAGNGTLTSALSIDGNVAPGAFGLAPDLATLNVTGDVTFGSTAGSIFQINKAGAVNTSDKLNITGAVTFGGILHVTATGDTLVFGDTFDLFDASNGFSGNVAFDLPGLTPGLEWDQAAFASTGDLTVVPEPTGCALLLGGLSLLAARRRRA